MSIYRTLFLFLFALVLVGAGCSGGQSTSSVDGGVFKSSDSSETWNQVSAYPTASGVANIGSVNVLDLRIDPSDSNAVYVGTTNKGLLFSYDAAETWQSPIDEALRSGAVRSIDIDSKDVCHIYAVKEKSLLVTEDCNRNYKSVYDETREKVSPLIVSLDWFNPEIVYLGLSNGDLLKSADSGKTWSKILSTGRVISDIVVSNKDSRVVYIGTDRDGIYKSTDGGENWNELADAFSEFPKGRIVYSLEQDSAGDNIVAVTKHGLLLSEDEGVSWSEIPLVTSAGQVDIRAFAIDPDDSDIMYYATNSTFYITTDRGETWNTERLPSSRAANALVIDPSDRSVMYLGVLKTE